MKLVKEVNFIIKNEDLKLSPHFLYVINKQFHKLTKFNYLY